MDGTADRAAAHGGTFVALPGASTCATCHGATVALAASSLHTNLRGYETILADRGFALGAGTESRARYDAQCTKCHAATVAAATAETACGQCHVSVPDTAGGGLVAGHRMSRTPDTVNNCTACHGSRVKDEYFGLNQALYARNRQYSASLAATDPFGGATLQPDVHRKAGMACTACHEGAEMHGQGAPTAGDRYDVAGGPECTTCHAPTDAGFAAVGLHTSGHVQSMSCHVCHAQPYKSCFSCHTQETASGAAYFANNVTDPTRDARRVPPAWSSTVAYAAGVYVTYNAGEYRSLQAANTNHLPDEASSTWWVAALAPLPPGDALITFRVGKNPRYGVQAGAKEYAVLRHVPVDPDTFTYTDEGTPAPGLITDLTALPTWKFATPHNIARVTPITQACGNCHGAGYSAFWLTDAIGDAHGWVPDTSTWEDDANAPYRVTAPIPYSFTP